MEFALGTPAPALRSLVAAYHGTRFEGLAPGAFQGLPSRHVTLIVSLEAPIEIAALPDPRQAPARFDAFVGGLHGAPATVRHDGRQHVVQLHVEPLGVRAWLGVPAAALASHVVALADVIGPRAEELRERLAHAASWEARFRVLDEVLASLRRARPEPPPEVVFAWRALCATRGRIAVGELARQTGWSRRHLGECFRAVLGLSPKQAARVLRFEAACEALARAKQSRLADLALACGYHDQAHLTREFRALSGASPAEWVRRELPFVQDELLLMGDELVSEETTACPTSDPS
jgi:AraC-like DNA-binding protein